MNEETKRQFEAAKREITAQPSPQKKPLSLSQQVADLRRRMSQPRPHLAPKGAAQQVDLKREAQLAAALSRKVEQLRKGREMELKKKFAMARDKGKLKQAFRRHR